MKHPAFILGNGPSLPTDSLGVLANQFTVGVNRILRSGFTPTVLIWVDSSVYEEEGSAMDASGAVLVCDRSVVRRPEHLGLQTYVGDSALRCQSAFGTLCCNGNTGCCAARWALALGCRPVYLLGMEAVYRDGRTDFYGGNPWHGQGTLAGMKEQVERLVRDFPEQVANIGDGSELERIVSSLPDVDLDNLTTRLRADLRRATHGT